MTMTEYEIMKVVYWSFVIMSGIVWTGCIGIIVCEVFNVRLR